MGDINHGHIQWKSLESVGRDDQQFLLLIHNNNNINFFCANILENQAQWRDKTSGLITLIIESNARVVNGWMEKLGG